MKTNNDIADLDQDIYCVELFDRCKKHKLEVKSTNRDNDYVITNNHIPRSSLVRVINPDKRSLAIYGRKPHSSHKCEVSVHYNFNSEDLVYPPDIMVFAWRNQVMMRTDFLIIKREELIKKLRLISGESGQNPESKLLLWVFPNDFVFVASHLSGEGEWYLLGSGLARNGDRDFSQYINRWDLL